MERNIETERVLRLTRLKIRCAKTGIFAVQDAADVLGDHELSRRVQEVRDWIEAADRRATDLAITMGAAS